MSPSRTTTNAENETTDHHRGFDSIYGVKADDADDEPAHSDAEFHRRAAAFGGGERRVLATIRSEESTMMTELQLADRAVKLRLATILFIRLINESNNFYKRHDNSHIDQRKWKWIVECLIVF